MPSAPVKRAALLGLLLLGTTTSAARAESPRCERVSCWRWFKTYMATADSYYVVPPMRPHAPKLPLRPRVEYTPAVVQGAPPSILEARVPAYTRPPATIYGPAVAAPGPGVPIYGPHNNAIAPEDPFGFPHPVYPPAYGSGDPSACSVFHR